VTIRNAGKRLAANAERHLNRPAKWRACSAPARGHHSTQDLLSRIAFTLDDLRYEYPHDRCRRDGNRRLLEQLSRRQRTPNSRMACPRATARPSPRVRLIRARNYACYFLTVTTLCATPQPRSTRSCARAGAVRPIRWSATCLHHPIDPVEQKLLFSRFLSEERNEPPDIDVDFEHERARR